MFGEQKRRFKGDVQMEDRASSRLWGLVVMVGVKEKGVISKGTGGCPSSSFAAVVKKTQSGIYNTTTSVLSSPSLHPRSKNKKQ